MNTNGTPSTSMALLRHSPASTASGGREDCWTEDATFTLIEAWGDRYLECNRGNVRQKDWQQVADTVNHRHHKHQPTRRRTDIQCKNRIDTLKKKYKIEKANFNDSGGNYVSPWPFFSSLDALIGTTFPAAKKLSPSPSPIFAFSTPIPVAPRSATVKRPARVTALLPALSWSSPHHQKFTAFAAAAAAAAEGEEGATAAEKKRMSWEGSEGSRLTLSDKKMKRGKSRDGGAGYRALADAVERFGEIYERVEGAKLKQMTELEKQRMQFAKDLEFQRVQFSMDTQIKLQQLSKFTF